MDTISSNYFNEYQFYYTETYKCRYVIIFLYFYQTVDLVWNGLYYFSDFSINKADTFHITSFRGRPNQKIRDLILKFDIKLRMLIRKFFKKGIIKNVHVYDRKK